MEDNKPVEEEGLFSLKQEEFKGLNIDFWIDMAVRQCLTAGLLDSQRFFLAVNNLEGSCATRLDEEYFTAITKARSELASRMPEAKVDFALSDTKFRELISLINRRKAEEKIYEL